MNNDLTYHTCSFLYITMTVTNLQKYEKKITPIEIYKQNSLVFIKPQKNKRINNNFKYSTSPFPYSSKESRKKRLKIYPIKIYKQTSFVFNRIKKINTNNNPKYPASPFPYISKESKTKPGKESRGSLFPPFSCRTPGL